jgi:hypothetical protein
MSAWMDRVDMDGTARLRAPQGKGGKSQLPQFPLPNVFFFSTSVVFCSFTRHELVASAFWGENYTTNETQPSPDLVND